MTDHVSEAVGAMLRECAGRLEAEAEAFLKMGYTLDELTIVIHDDGSREVCPKETIA